MIKMGDSMDKEKVSIFVPGRLCIIGEHSDWASNYRINNPTLEDGMAVITILDEGIYANIEKFDSIYISNDKEVISCKMNEIDYIIDTDDYWKYAIGTCRYIKEKYNCAGIKIEIYKNTLPMKKGLASSAAICTLVVKAYNKLYNLGLNDDIELEEAYEVEQSIGSKCGRLDQVSVSDSKLQLVEFKQEKVVRHKLHVKKDIYMVYADLNGEKDTIKILNDLNKCYPYHKNEQEKLVQEFLGIENVRYCKKAKTCIENGEIEKLGSIMNEYQARFDEVLIPVSKELKAPLLHEIINDKFIKTLVYGIKGCGSGGDGAVQFLAKNEYSQKILYDYLNKKLNKASAKITIKSNTIKKAIIPIGGYGTRMYPMTKIIGKEFLPLMDSDSRIKPAIVIMLKELIDAGIEEIALVLPQKYQDNYMRLFTKNVNYKKFDIIEQELQEIFSKITFIDDDKQNGLSNAISLCKKFISGDKFLIVLGDQIYKSKTDKTCLKQIIDFYNESNKCLIPVCETNMEDVEKYGILKGNKVIDNKYFKINNFVEKPSIEIAKQYLYTTDGNTIKYYSVFGCYLLDDKFIKLLDISKEFNDNLKKYIDLYEPLAFIPNGKYYDIGNNQSYCKTFIEFCGGKYEEN